MHVILLVLGLIGAVAGAALIAINIPIDQVATGHVLVIAGMIAIAAGAILAGLAVVNRQLREILQAFETPPLMAAPEAVDTEVVIISDTPPADSPPAATPPVVTLPAVEMPPKPDPTPPAAPKPARDLGDIRPGAPPSAPPSAPPPPPAAVPEKKPLDVRPRSEVPPPAAPPAPSRAEPPLSPSRAAPLLSSSEPLLPEPKMSDFDSLWAKATQETRRDPPMHDDRPPPAPRAAEPPPPEPARPAPAPPQPPPAPRVAEPPRREPPPPEAPAIEPEHAAETAPPESGGVKIFKSGVIDGMAYALYTDGSIEAELPQGKVRFATVEELRIYLDGIG